MTEMTISKENRMLAEDLCSEILGIIKRDQEHGEFSGLDITMLIANALQKKDDTKLSALKGNIHDY